MWDLIIRGATVYDGSGGPSYVADIAVKDGVISAVGTDGLYIGDWKMSHPRGLASAPRYLGRFIRENCTNWGRPPRSVLLI